MTADDTGRPADAGWDRARCERAADALLSAVTRHASPSFARIELPGRSSWSGPDSDALEGFARTFLLAALRIAGARGTGPEATALLDRYASGLTAGADPDHPEAWPRISADRGQPMVEAASVALALHLTRPWLWDALDPGAREHVLDWLGGFVGRRTVPNNWMLFQTLVEEFLCSAGAEHRHDEIVRGLDALEGWYLGDGWYTDGDRRRIDHYNGWALHLYPLMWTRMASGGPRRALAEERAATYRARLHRFLTDYVHLVGADGAPLHQGRSLTYRFAAAAPLWTGALFDCSPLAPGLTRRAATGVLRHFADRGAPGPDGLLSLGWYDAFLPMTQPYSGPASPYWAAKGFLGLLLPATHPVWTAPEEPLPVERADTLTRVAPANWLVQGTAVDGIVRLHNHGSDGAGLGSHGDDPFYARLAYSTTTGPWIEPSEHRPDNQLVLTTPDGTTLRRGPLTPLGTVRGDTWATAGSRYVPLRPGADDTVTPEPDVRVETHTVAHGRFEIRLHAVTAPAGWRVREGGHPLAAASPPATGTGRWASAVRVDGTVSALAPLHGHDRLGVSEAEGVNALGRHAALPYLTADHPGGTALYASCAVLSAAPLDLAAPPPLTLRVRETRVEIDLPDGRTVRFDRTRDTAGPRLVPRPDRAGPVGHDGGHTGPVTFSRRHSS
ncbi:DUF2264 domain-containing protein [Streptomyces sp. NPDC005955]|uniref:DUF2264 domain-containing protein n=1 Tax=Streptomyces sp. NPDC005955 TaxID=3364738 RepID=UPI0036B8D1C6